MGTGQSLQVNSSRNIASSRSFIGFGASLDFKNRNTFKGGEVLSVRTELGIEVNPGGRFFELGHWSRTTSNLNIGADLYFPKLRDHPLGTTKLIRKFSPKGYNLLRESADTRASLNYNVISAVNNYRINIFAGSWGYEWLNSKNNRFTFNQIGINFLDPSFSQSFQDTVLSQNPFLENSLTEQLFTGFIARDFSVLIQSKPTKKNGSWLFRGNIEQSGAEIAAINGIYNVLSSNIETDTFRFLGNKYEFSQYFRLELDGRYYWNRSRNKTFAFRGHFGIATPFAFSNDVPYTKQFSVGGPTSMRGWIIRELGPGSFVEDLPEDNNFFYQTGDLKLEFNAEFRFDLFWVFKGAVFLDVGNVWALGTDDRTGANFDLNEFAVNSGIGLRIDASIFLLRFDIGMPLRNPYIDDTLGRHWLVRTPTEWWASREFWNPNLAIGYPF